MENKLTLFKYTINFCMKQKYEPKSRNEGGKKIYRISFFIQIIRLLKFFVKFSNIKLKIQIDACQFRIFND